MARRQGPPRRASPGDASDASGKGIRPREADRRRMPEKPVGKVEHYYPKVQAAAVRLSKKVKVGDQVHIVGHGDDFKEKVTSLQLDHEPIQEGQPGQSVGLWVKERVHEGDD